MAIKTVVDDLLAALNSDTGITNYVNALANDDSLAGRWKRHLLPGARPLLTAELKGAGPGEAAVEAAALVALATTLAEPVIIAGGVVTDHGAADSKVDVTAGRFLSAAGAIVSFAAVNGLATLDTKTISVSTAGVVSSNTGVPGGNMTLASVAVNAGVCTPTNTRRGITVAVVS